MITHKIKVIPSVFKSITPGGNYIEMVDDKGLYHEQDKIKVREFLPFLNIPTGRSKTVIIQKFTRVHRAVSPGVSIRFFVVYKQLNPKKNESK